MENELENKIWYRAYKMGAILIIIGAFLAPSIQDGLSQASLLNGFINFIIWLFGLIILQKIIIYILYGQKIKK